MMTTTSRCCKWLVLPRAAARWPALLVVGEDRLRPVRRGRLAAFGECHQAAPRRSRASTTAIGESSWVDARGRSRRRLEQLAVSGDVPGYRRRWISRCAGRSDGRPSRVRSSASSRNHWGLIGDWTARAEAVIMKTTGSERDELSIHVHARDVHLVIGPAWRRERYRCRCPRDVGRPGAGCSATGPTSTPTVQ